MGRFAFAVLMASIALMAVACTVTVGDDKKDGGGNPPAKPNPHRVDWSTVPADYHPKIDETSFQINGASRIEIDTFGSDKDFEVVYSSSVVANTGTMRVFSVWYDSARWGSTQTQSAGDTLKISSTGVYECSIKIENARITALKGACNVRTEVVLPSGAQVEVYNLGKLASKRIFPMKTEQLLKNVDDAIRKEDKLQAIDDYLKSHAETGKTPSLTAKDLGTVIKEFSFKDEKFEALRRLQAYVADRSSLRAMIEDSFGHFDREEARRICGV